MKKLVLVLALLLSATIPALSQTNPIQSRIVDLSGVSMPDVTITEMSRCTSSTPPTDASATKTYVTDANGNFSWPALLPETLANRRILVRDSAGVEKPARLFFVSPTQINYLMPEGLQNGAMVVKLMSSANELIKADLGRFESIAPGVFTANSDGGGVPASFVTRVQPGNVQTTEPVAQLDVAQSRFVPLPIDLGPETEFVVLTLFGTGWRQLGSLPNTKVTIGGVDCPVEYVGPQPTFFGVDQINARLPRALISKGEVDVKVSFFIDLDFTNTVKLSFK